MVWKVFGGTDEEGVTVQQRRRDAHARMQEQQERMIQAYESDYPGTFRTAGPHIGMVRDWKKNGYKIFANIDGKTVTWFLSDGVLQDCGKMLHIDIGKTMIMEMK